MKCCNQLIESGVFVRSENDIRIFCEIRFYNRLDHQTSFQKRTFVNDIAFLDFSLLRHDNMAVVHLRAITRLIVNGTRVPELSSKDNNT